MDITLYSPLMAGTTVGVLPHLQLVKDGTFGTILLSLILLHLKSNYGITRILAMKFPGAEGIMLMNIVRLNTIIYVRMPSN